MHTGCSKFTRQGTSSELLIVVCAFMPPFFLPVMGFLPTPLKQEPNNEIVVESTMKIFESLLCAGLSDKSGR